MALVLWDASRGDASRLKGIGVGVAAGIKLTPAYFVLYYWSCGSGVLPSSRSAPALPRSPSAG